MPTLTGRAKSRARRAAAKASRKSSSSTTTTKTPTTMQEKYDANEALAQRRRFGMDIPEGSVEYKTDLNHVEDTPVQSTASYRMQTKDRMADLERIKSEAMSAQERLDQIKAEKAAAAAGGTGAPATDPTVTTDPNDPFAGVTNRIAAIELQYEKDKETLFDDYDQLQTTADKEYRGIIRGIKKQFQARIDLMKETNSRVLAAQNVNNLRSGTARYAAEMAAGLMTEEEQQGHLRLTQIEGEMSAALVAAAEAKAEGDLEAFNSVYDQLDSLTKNMNDQIKENFNMAVKRNQEIRANNQEQRLQAKAELDAMLDKSGRAAPALAARIAELPPEQQAAVIEAYAAQNGIDPEVLLGDVVGAAQDMDYKNLQAKNLENQIYNRNRDTNIAAAREARLSKEAADEETKYSDLAVNIADGVQTLNDLAESLKPDEMSKVVAELNTLGFYSDEPPMWFMKTVDEEFSDLMDAKGGSPTPEFYRTKWNELRAANGITTNNANRFRGD